MALIDIKGVRLNVEVCGEGFPLVLVHGAGMSLDQWKLEGFLDRLSTRNKIIAYDCRGHGLSEKPQGYTLEDHANDVLNLLDYLGIARTNLLGHSMGSYIAQRVAIKEPSRIAKLLLIAPKSNGLTSSLEKILTENAELLSRLDMKEKLDFMDSLVVFQPQVLKKYPNLVRNSLTPEEQNAAYAALRGFDFREDLKSVTAKTLVIAGRHDRLNPPDEGRVCAEAIPNARFVEMQYSGHIPLAEEPELYIETVSRFLDESRSV
jgi:3-oxoadipate enol-lactonase